MSWRGTWVAAANGREGLSPRSRGKRSPDSRTPMRVLEVGGHANLLQKPLGPDHRYQLGAQGPQAFRLRSMGQGGVVAKQMLAQRLVSSRTWPAALESAGDRVAP